MKRLLLVVVAGATLAFTVPGGASAANFYCDGPIVGVVPGNVIVQEGKFCIALGATIHGFVRVDKGALGFHAHGSTIDGNVHSFQDIVFDIRVLDSHVGGNVIVQHTHEGTFGAICRSTIDGSLHWTDNGGFQTIGVGFPFDVCTAGNTIHGNVVLSNNNGAVNFDFNNNDVAGNVDVGNNVGFEDLFSNDIAGILNCSNNMPAPVSFTNTARNFVGQCTM